MVDGDPNAPVMFVGGAPDRDDIDQGRPFSGASGWLLWSTAKMHGIRRDRAYMVNVIGEWPERKSGVPSAAQLGKYRDEFEAYVSRFRGHIVVPMGGDALEAICGFRGITDWRGYKVDPRTEIQPATVSKQELVPRGANKYCKCRHKVEVAQEGTKRTKKVFVGDRDCDLCRGTGVLMAKGEPMLKIRRVSSSAPLHAGVEWILPVLSPGSVLRSGKKTMPAFNADLARVGRGIRRAFLQDEKFAVEQYDAILPPPEPSAPFVLDFETVPEFLIGLSARGADGQLVACNAPLTKGSWEAFTKWTTDRSRTLIAHNAQFDLAELHKMGIKWNGDTPGNDAPVWDTMMAAYILQPDLFKGLNNVCSLYFDMQRWKHRSEENLKWYNMMDVKYEYLLHDVLREELRAEGLLERFERVFMPAIHTFTRMTRHGLPLHAERRRVWCAHLEVENSKNLMKWHALSDGCNPNTPRKVAAVLYKKYGMPVQFSHKSGNETAEAAALYGILSKLADDDPRRDVINTLLEYRKTNKLLTTYARKPVGDDGRVHPYYLPSMKDSDIDGISGAAGSGRVQPRDPNPTQLPPDARAMVIPPGPEFELVSIDYRQLELRIAASLSGDRRLLALLAEGDPFAQLSARFKCDRTRAKNLAYGVIYGGGPGALVNALKRRGVHMSRPEAKALQVEFATEFPTLWGWREGIMEDVGRTYRIVTPFGRPRYFHQGRGDAPAAVNQKCQGTAADIQWENTAGLEAVLAEYGAVPLILVHDEWVIAVKRMRRDSTIRAACDYLEREFPQVAPGFFVPTGVKVGDDWKDMAKYEREEYRQAA